MTDLSVILPTFNEVENIVPMIESINTILSKTASEIIVVDDNSPDGTSQAVSAVLSKYPRVKLVTRKSNKGLVNSIREGIEKSEGDICVWMDADLSMPANKILTLVRQIELGADLAVGSRYVEGGGIKGSHITTGKTTMLDVWNNLRSTEDSFLAVAISKYGNVFARFILDRKYYDYTSGFYAVRKSVISEIGLEGDYLDYCIHLLYKAAKKGFIVNEIPVTIVPRVRGKSKTSDFSLAILPLVFKCVMKIVALKFTTIR